jgi:hypothetical protein
MQYQVHALGVQHARSHGANSVSCTCDKNDLIVQHAYGILWFLRMRGMTSYVM